MRPSTRRDARQTTQGLDGPPCARKPAVDTAPEAGTGGCPPVPGVEPLSGDRSRLPLDRSPDPLVLQPSEADERAQQVAVQAVDHPAVRPLPAEPAARCLRVFQDVGACALDPAVAGIRADLIEERERPDRPRVLRPVARAGL